MGRVDHVARCCKQLCRHTFEERGHSDRERVRMVGDIAHMWTC